MIFLNWLLLLWNVLKFVLDLWKTIHHSSELSLLLFYGTLDTQQALRMYLFHIYLLFDLHSISRINFTLTLDTFHFLNLLLNILILEILKICMYALEVWDNGLHLMTGSLKFILKLLKLYLVLRFTLVLSSSNHFSSCFGTNLLAYFFGFAHLSHRIFLIFN